MKFNSEQMSLLRKISPYTDFSSEVDDDVLLELEDKVSDYFALHGLANQNRVNDTGRICEEIMDILAD